MQHPFSRLVLAQVQIFLTKAEKNAFYIKTRIWKLCWELS